MAVEMSNRLENGGPFRTSKTLSGIPDGKSQSWATPMSAPRHVLSPLSSLYCSLRVAPKCGEEMIDPGTHKHFKLGQRQDFTLFQF